VAGHVTNRAGGAVPTGLTIVRPTTAKADPANAEGRERCGLRRTLGLVAVLVWVRDARTVNGPTSGGDASVPATRAVDC
jgi:hypothetical protein